jgi:hypothetical protein
MCNRWDRPEIAYKISAGESEGERTSLGDLGAECETILKLILNDEDVRCALDPSGSR